MTPTARRRVILAALWVAVAGVVLLFDWGVSREPRTTYDPPGRQGNTTYNRGR